jgi:DHA1 family multidrug resistance protein-like MFS transporter
MFNGMGIQWASTLLGCVAAIAVPMPFFFYVYGKRIRSKSKFAPAPDIEQDKRRDEESRGVSSGESEGMRGEGTNVGDNVVVNGSVTGVGKKVKKEE